jgi:hypothetical protein
MKSTGIALLAVMVALTVIAACSTDQSPAQNAGTAPRDCTPASDAPFGPFASIKELMDSTVDPAADGLWDAVSTSITSKGTEEKQPRTDDEWKAVRRHAITLIEATNLLIMRDRHSAPAGTEPGRNELSPREIDQKLAKHPRSFKQFAIALRLRPSSPGLNYGFMGIWAG